MRYLSPPKYIPLACQPKSGSTFLSQAIGNLPNFRNGSFVPGYDRREQELDAGHIRWWRFSGHRAAIAQQHVRCSQPTLRLIKRFDMQPVVLIRDFFDTIVSIRDHFRQDVTTSPMAYFDKSHFALDDQQLEEAIARLLIPWYVNFYMTWRDVVGTVVVNYMDMTQHPTETIRLILDHAGLRVDETAIEAAIVKAQSGSTRFNKGVVGRGGLLSHDTRQIVLDCLKFYPKARNDPFIAAMFDAP